MRQKWGTDFNNQPLTKFDVLSGFCEVETKEIARVWRLKGRREVSGNAAWNFVTIISEFGECDPSRARRNLANFYFVH